LSFFGIGELTLIAFAVRRRFLGRIFAVKVKKQGSILLAL
jgi:hypothetical protein